MAFFVYLCRAQKGSGFPLKTIFKGSRWLSDLSVKQLPVTVEQKRL